MMEQTIQKTRYSDSELNDFKTLIQDKLDIARKELKELLGNLNSSNSNGDDDIAGKTLEDGSATYEKEHNTQLAARQKKFIDQLEAAMVRIRNKTYASAAVQVN